MHNCKSLRPIFRFIFQVGFLITSFVCEDVEPITGSLSSKDLERPVHVLVQHGKSK